MLVRVQKILASAGVASRRKCEELILQGRVLVNNKKIILGTKADPEKDSIMVNNKPIKIEKKVYYVVNKPKNYISTVSDELGRRSVIELVPKGVRVFPVGRLDRDARGLMILTNDGELANRVMHPRYETEKTYKVTVRERIKDEDMARLRRGVWLEGRKVIPSSVVKTRINVLEILLHEGRKHVVKRLLFKLGYFVTDLLRVQIGNLSVRGLKEGEYREMSDEELISLRGLFKEGKNIA